MAMGGWNNVGAMGSSQQAMKFDANKSNAAAANSLINSGMKVAFGSDRRLKTNITRIGTRPDGLGVYQWNYVWGGPRMVGVMADEVRKKYPQAVARLGGYDMVDYSALGG
jgi:hypothetical protein